MNRNVNKKNDYEWNAMKNDYELNIYDVICK